MKKFIVISTLLVWLSTGIAACNKSSPSDIYQSSSYVQVIASSVKELYDRSEIVIIGSAEETKKIINMARDVYDPSKPDKSLFIIGQIYEIKVDEYLKGTGPGLIYVVQEEGIIRNTFNLGPEDIAKAKSQDLYIPIVADRDYLMFLRPMLGGVDDTYFSGTSHPWRFNIDDRNLVVPESPWNDADRYFPPRTLEQTITLFDVPTIPLDSSYPEPTTPYP